MEQFKTRPDGFREVRKAVLIKTVPIMILAASAGMAIGLFNNNTEQSGLNVLPFVIPIVLAALMRGIYLGVKKRKQIFDSYVLTIDSNSITREQHNTQAISIPTAEMSSMSPRK